MHPSSPCSQALALLSNLLQKDYVKWRGPLFHRFLLALVDDIPHVAGLAEYMLSDTLTTKVRLQTVVWWGCIFFQGSCCFFACICC